MSMPTEGGPQASSAQLQDPQAAPGQTGQPAAPKKTWWKKTRDIIFAPWKVVFAKVKEWPALVTVAGVVIVGAGAGALYYFWQPITDTLNHAEDGKIMVNSPTVYTRQRLVNDRLDQARWLRTQLDFTDERREKDFKSIDAVRQSTTETKATAGIGLATKSSDDKDQTKNAAEIAVEETTMSLFRAKNAYREEVRSELTQTELDDRHDIKGNTIYRLTFDTSIVAGMRESAVAAIAIQLDHHPLQAQGALKRIYEDDYRSLYRDWARKFQDTINTSMTGISASLLAPVPQANLRLLFTDFLLNRICEFIAGAPRSEDVPQPCGRDQQIKVERLLKEYTQNRTKTLQKIKDDRFLAALLSYRKAGFRFPPGTDSFFVATAAGLCGQGNLNEIPLAQLQILKPAQKASTPSNSPAPIDGVKNSGDGSTKNTDAPANATAKQPPQPPQRVDINNLQSEKTNDLVGCPFYYSLKENLVSGVLLYEKIFAIATGAYSEGDAWQIVPSPDDYSAFGSRALADVKSPDNCIWKGICYVNDAQLRCFAADFIKSTLNLFSQRFSGQEIDDFLTLRTVGREINDCNILVIPFPKKREKNMPQATELEAFLKFFEKELNLNTDAFAYSVTPKNLAENISTAAETRDAFELLARNKATQTDVGSFLRSRSERNRAIVAHPIVVGFGSSDFNHLKKETASPEGVRNIDFGWIIAGRLGKNKSYSHIDGQYALSSFISVPGWWQTVNVIITRCWISRTALTELEPTANATTICPKGTPSVQTTVRLPGAIPEISHKLGFDVVQQPSIVRPRQHELVVGRRGSLLLEGQRLWRSTEVTAGGQRADKITVLPNMEGILAEFDCIRPPAGVRQTRTNDSVPQDNSPITTAYARVWTSEGVTELVPLVFIWPKEFEVTTTACLTDSEKAALAQEKAKHDKEKKEESSGQQK